MVKTIRIAGFGGQGVMLMGQIMAATASNENLNSIWVPTYGPETRGGTANCMVTISDTPIYSPIFSKADVLIALNEPSYIKFADQVKGGGLIIYNASLAKAITPIKGVTYLGVEANELALSLGEPKVMNMIILGAFLGNSQLFTNAQVMKTLATYFGEKKASFLPINEKALELGRKQA